MEFSEEHILGSCRYCAAYVGGTKRCIRHNGVPTKSYDNSIRFVRRCIGGAGVVLSSEESHLSCMAPLSAA